MPSVRVLPDHLINQIAAGEVIERPASVVKELVENALDAGARTIDVAIEAGGRSRIRVADDGSGMNREDAILSLQRHATSKLSADSDLGSIATLGFRGEALPAIASVSRLTLSTSADGATGTRIETAGGSGPVVSGAGHPRGTTVDVRDLFFNTPARAKFLKTAGTEMGHIVDAVSGLAAALPDVAFSVTHEGRRILDAPRTTGIQQRLRQIDGAAWRQAVGFDASSRGVRAHGFVLRPEETSSARRNQRIHVNGRVVRDRLIGHAILAACEAFLPRGRYPAAALFIECPPGAVDVNVHPAKAEVRFRDPRGVHEFVKETLVAALAEALPVTPMALPAPDGAASLHEAVRRYAARAEGQDAIGREAGRLRSGAGASSGDSHEAPAGEAAARTRSAGAEAPGPALFGGPVALAHYRQSYIVAQDDEGLLLVDQHAAHERILFDRLVADLERGQPERQDLLFPVTIVAPRRSMERLADLAAELTALGFAAEPFGEDTLVVRGVPAAIERSDPVPLIEELLDRMDEEEPPDGGPLGRRERLVATVACHAAVKVRMPLTPEKMNYLISALFRTRIPLKCPHGRPAVVRFAHQQIERSFDRP